MYISILVGNARESSASYGRTNADCVILREPLCKDTLRIDRRRPVMRRSNCLLRFSQYRGRLVGFWKWHTRQSPMIWLDYAMIAVFVIAGFASAALPN